MPIETNHVISIPLLFDALQKRSQGDIAVATNRFFRTDGPDHGFRGGLRQPDSFEFESGLLQGSRHKISAGD